MKMKSIDLFCASPASTAICSNMGQRAIARPGPRPVERLGDTPKNRTNAAAAPCSSLHLPLDPSRRSYHKSRKNISKSTNLRRKSSADVDDLAGPGHISSKYLLSDRPFLDVIPNSDTHNKYNNNNKRLDLENLIKGFRSFSTDEYPIYKPAGVDSLNNHSFGHDHLTPRKSSSLPSNRSQVVELRVSIHCKGCEGKLRKYISRMEGVTSFSIDLSTKKVTVVGNVTPSGVLTSISRVKNAQLWSSSLSSTSSSSPRVGLAR